mmetsp:Transcript_12766/g.23193  ORF Transcript_12766/g.23193 Transcript_12766/m.23193 type:complete len:227 (+) Transcript_12766:46-726(+)|eukprot:CAMPEP_0197531552 /NCGR_PEP_ID=MMETSP1318-20131121/36151_1 /TAXON_ID=552666 /ORGANISM="Partenskyella glossopodia, Strain RCC365" /LENGTH=226 /DNA_ID=CAMNT_0043087815 /DNA_START=48 /DNA_END=728 /DNA_ORIENTATION=+
MNRVRQGVTLVLLALSLLFLWVSFLGTTGLPIGWSKMEQHGLMCNTQYWVGLSKYRALSEECEFDKYVSWDSNQCHDELGEFICKNCKDSGAAVLSFAVLTSISLLASIVIVLVRYRFKLSEAKVMILAALGVTSFFSFIMWVVWAASCDRHLKENMECVGCTVTIKLSAGWAMSWLVFITAMLAGVNELAAPDDCEDKDDWLMGSVASFLGSAQESMQKIRTMSI